MQTHKCLRLSSVEYSQYLVKKTQYLVKHSQHLGQRFPRRRSRKTKLRSNIPNIWSRKSNSVKDSQVPVKNSQDYNSLTVITKKIPTKTFCRIRKSSYLCPRYKHIVKPLCMTWTDCIPRQHTYINIGGSLFPTVSRGRSVCSRTVHGCRLFYVLLRRSDD